MHERGTLRPFTTLTITVVSCKTDERNTKSKTVDKSPITEIQLAKINYD